MPNPTGPNHNALQTVQQQFEMWRSHRSKRQPIPEHLWDAAAGLCQSYPITQVCRHLRISFADLKKRISTTRKPPVQFMDFDLSCLSGGWRLECDRADGARLRLSGSGQVPAICDVLRQFLS